MCRKNNRSIIFGFLITPSLSKVILLFKSL